MGSPVIINRLPNELLSEVFTFSTNTPIKVPPPLQDSDFPWALLRVCKRWRRVALATPNLWNDVFINYDDDDMFAAPNIHKHMAAAEKILKRTQDTSISLKIKALGFYDSGTWMSRTFDLVVLQSARITSLTILINISSIESFFRLENVPFPFLESLTIDDGHGVNAIDMSIGLVHPSYEVSVWKNAPRLRTLSLGANIPWAGNTSSLAWAQLTDITLRVTRLSVKDAHFMLRLSSNVVSLKITPGVLRDRHERHANEPVNLPHLTELTAEFYCSDDLPAFLRPLVVPRLRILSTRYPKSGHREPGWNSSLIPIVARFPALEGIVCSDCVPLGDIHALLVALPWLKTLTLPSPLSGPILAGLSAGTLLPCLKALDCRVTPLVLKSHLEMLGERGKSPGGATKVLAELGWHCDYLNGFSSAERTVVLKENALLIVSLMENGLLDLDCLFQIEA